MALDVLSTSDLAAGTPALGPVLLSVDPTSIWPFVPNWRAEVVEEYEFNTDVFTSRAHREQRRALRVEPRKKWEFQSMAYRDGYRESMAVVTSRFDSKFHVINPIYSAVLSAPFGTLEWVMTVTDPPGWMVPDAIVVLVHGDDQRPYRITAVDGDLVTVAGVSGMDWPIGSRVRLAEPVYTDTLRVEAETASVITLRNALAVDPSYSLYSGASVAEPLFNGRELFLKKPNWREGIGLDISTEREAVDYGHGLTSYFSPVSFNLRDYRMIFLGRDLAEVEAVVNFFRRMKGRRDEFYAPTHTSDISPSVDLSGATLRTAGRFYYSAFNNSALVDSASVLKALIVFLADGTYLTRIISGVTLVAGDSIFNLTVAWPGTIALANIRKVSFLPVCRFATDKLAVEWQTNQVAQFTLTMRALEAL